MPRITIFVNYIQGEKFWASEQPVPSQLQVTTNLNITGIDQKEGQMLNAPFIFTINYNPAIAQITIRGHANIQGEAAELDEIVNGYKDRKPPPPMLIQSISNMSFIEALILTRTLNIPPPIPLPSVPAPSTQKEKGPEHTYTA
jgi:hypothetical protein